MSRCFPYPPPGFFKSGDGVVSEVLKERLKIKDKKKEEKKKDKKYKADEQNGMGKEKKHREHKKYKHEKVKELLKVGGSIKEENEQMEKSCVTEEHEQPVCTQNLSDSFDSGHRGGKRKRPHGGLSRPCEPPTHKMQLTTCDTGGNHGKCSLKIKISIVRNSEQLQPCYQGSSTTLAGPSQVVEASAVPRSDVGISGDPQTLKRVSDAGTCDWEYGTGEWLPLLPPLPSESLLPENLNWLFGENPSRCEAKKLNAHGGSMDKDIPRVWSQASYLPSVSSYALPYVLPF